MVNTDRQVITPRVRKSAKVTKLPLDVCDGHLIHARRTVDISEPDFSLRSQSKRMSCIHAITIGSGTMEIAIHSLDIAGGTGFGET
jgi:hypothetical protein